MSVSTMTTLEEVAATRARFQATVLLPTSALWEVTSRVRISRSTLK